jgi:hypothetical protein
MGTVQAEQQTPVGAARIINTVAIANQTPLIATEI